MEPGGLLWLIFYRILKHFVQVVKTRNFLGKLSVKRPKELFLPCLAQNDSSTTLTPKQQIEHNFDSSPGVS